MSTESEEESVHIQGLSALVVAICFTTISSEVTSQYNKSVFF